MKTIYKNLIVNLLIAAGSTLAIFGHNQIAFNIMAFLIIGCAIVNFIIWTLLITFLLKGIRVEFIKTDSINYISVVTFTGCMLLFVIESHFIIAAGFAIMIASHFLTYFFGKNIKT